MITSREGASFARLAKDVFLIPVFGGQFLHHDRHLSTISKDEAGGFSEHTWNLAAEGSDDQMLVLEVSEKMFEHFTLEDRKSVVSGKSVSVRVDLGGRRIIQNKSQTIKDTYKTEERT